MTYIIHKRGEFDIRRYDTRPTNAIGEINNNKITIYSGNEFSIFDDEDVHVRFKVDTPNIRLTGYYKDIISYASIMRINGCSIDYLIWSIIDKKYPLFIEPLMKQNIKNGNYDVIADMWFRDALVLLNSAIAERGEHVGIMNGMRIIYTFDTNRGYQDIRVDYYYNFIISMQVNSKYIYIGTFTQNSFSTGTLNDEPAHIASDVELSHNEIFKLGHCRNCACKFSINEYIHDNAPIINVKSANSIIIN